METKKVLGVDIGNVIINYRLSDPNDKALYEERYSTIPAAEGVFEALKTLSDYFGGEVYLVSKCTEWAEIKILEWLEDHDFYKKTNIKRENIHIVEEREEKDVICRKLGVTHFIDNRLEVLSHMVESIPNLLLFQPDKDEVEKFKEFLPKVTVVETWAEVLNKIVT